jgi:hypothetical protein
VVIWARRTARPVHHRRARDNALSVAVVLLRRGHHVLAVAACGAGPRAAVQSLSFSEQFFATAFRS